MELRTATDDDCVASSWEFRILVLDRLKMLQLRLILGFKFDASRRVNSRSQAAPFGSWFSSNLEPEDPAEMLPVSVGSHFRLVEIAVQAAAW